MNFDAVVALQIAQFTKMLKNLDAWLTLGEELAKKKSFEPDVLLSCRLAPDQYPLVRQVQAACDQAKFAAAYLSGQKAPAHPDTEKTLREVRARIEACTSFLGSIKDAAYAGAAERKVAPPWMEGKWVRGDDYLLQLAIPNFYFHATTAYSILRHNGVDVGKMNYIGSLPMQG